MKIKWQDYLMIAIIVIYLLLQLNLINDFQQLPSPLYGGDYYFSMGTVNHVKDGGSAFKNSALLDSLPHYFPSYSLIVGNIAKIFNIEAFAAMKFFAILQIIIALIVFYLFMSYLFENKTIGILTTLLYLPLIKFPVWKYLHLTETLILPLFFFAMLYFYKKRNLLSAILAGLAFGLVGISHSVAFVVACLFFAVFALYIVFFRYIGKKFSFDKESFKKNLSKKIMFLAVIFVIGVLIALLYWFKPLFIFQGQQLNPIQNFDQHDFSRINVMLKFFWNNIQGSFLNFSSITKALMTLLVLTSIFLLFALKKYSKKIRFILIIAATAIIGTFHYFILQPILGTVLSPQYIAAFTMSFTVVLLIGFGISIISKIKPKKYFKHAALVFIVLFLILAIVDFKNYVKDDRWINNGKTQMQPPHLSMQTWITQNTDVNDVFLTNNELGFSVNALTGRKMLTFRRGHTDMFTNASERMMDAAIILYSNNDEKRIELIKKYNVKYFYWDAYWLQSEYQFNEKGEMIGTFDPLIVFDTEINRKILEQYNITYYAQHTWLDPSIRVPDVKQFDLLFILPNLNITHPWSTELDKYLEEEWHYEDYAKIFKVNV